MTTLAEWIGRPSHDAWLEAEGLRLLEFGARAALPEGGAAWLDDDGRPDPGQPLFTWVTARTVHVYALAALRGLPGAATVATRALAGLTGRLADVEHGGWFEGLAPDGTPLSTKSAYAHAFVVLAGSTATVAGLPGARGLLDDALQVHDERFWDDAAGLVRDGWDCAWTSLDPYRGVNANMHTVEALLAASDATGEPRWRDHALRIATRVADEFAPGNGWRIPEHFDESWTPRLEYNADRPDDPFKPYGATVGHGLEWSRLLLHLHASLRSAAPPWLLPAARELYARAVADGWAVDGEPGFVYTTDWSGTPVVRTRMHWVPAEAIGAAAALLHATGDRRYGEDYQRWWDHVATFFLDRERGSWHHELDPANRPSATVWPGKPDVYHAYQATLIPRAPLAPGLACAAASGDL